MSTPPPTVPAAPLDVINNKTVTVLNDVLQQGLSLRSQMFRYGNDPRRNLDFECGYPDVVRLGDYQQMYDRFGLAARIISLYPEEVWQEDPELFEDDDPETDTEAEKDWKEFNEEHSVWAELCLADELSRIGHFGVTVLGLDDNQDFSEPVREGDGSGEPDGVERHVNYMRSFPEYYINITQWDTDQQSARYGQPYMYKITFRDVQAGESNSAASMQTILDVHWSRLVHFTPNRKYSKIFGIPEIKPVYNHLMDLRKIYGASAEGYFRGGMPGWAFETNQDLTKGDVDFDWAGLKKQVADNGNGLQRALFLLGVNAKSLAPNVTDPSAHLEAAIRAIAITKGIPWRLLLGSEAAQLASGQDARNWNKRVRRVQTKYTTPYMVVPFVNHLNWLGVVKKPQNDNRWKLDWPDLNSPSDQDKATIAATLTTAMASYVTGGVDQFCPPIQWWTEVAKFDIDTAKKIVEAAEEHTAELQDQQAQMEQSGQVAPGQSYESEDPNAPPGGPNKPGAKPVRNNSQWSTVAKSIHKALREQDK